MDISFHRAEPVFFSPRKGHLILLRVNWMFQFSALDFEQNRIGANERGTAPFRFQKSAPFRYSEVLKIDPLATNALVNRGNTYKEIGRVNEAIQDYACAIAIRPTMAEAHANLALAYEDSGHVEAAIKSYKQALLLRPDFPEATCNLLHTLQCVCDWDDLEKMFIEVEGILKRQIKV